MFSVIWLFFAPKYFQSISWSSSGCLYYEFRPDVTYKVDLVLKISYSPSQESSSALGHPNRLNLTEVIWSAG